MKKTVSFLLALVLALTCTLSVGAQDLPFIPIGDKVEISALSLVLGGELGLTFHAKVPASYTSGYAVLSCKGGEPAQLNIADCPKDSQNRYMITYHLSSVQLSEKVTVKVFSKDGVQLATKAKSAEEYAAALIGDDNSTEKEIAVAKALMNYGHYAQLACRDCCGWTVGADYAATTAYAAPTVGENVFDAYRMQRAGTPLSGVTMQLKLGYQTDIILYLPAHTEGTATVDGAPAQLQKCAGGRYKLTISGINAMDLKDAHEITVGGTSLTLSAFSYGSLAMASAPDNTKQAMLSLYELSATVADYCGAE